MTQTLGEESNFRIRAFKYILKWQSSFLWLSQSHNKSQTWVKQRAKKTSLSCGKTSVTQWKWLVRGRLCVSVPFCSNHRLKKDISDSKFLSITLDSHFEISLVDMECHEAKSKPVSYQLDWQLSQSQTVVKLVKPKPNQSNCLITFATELKTVRSNNKCYCFFFYIRQLTIYAQIS